MSNQEHITISSAKVQQRLLRENIKRIHYFSALLSLFLLVFFAFLMLQYNGPQAPFLLGMTVAAEIICLISCITSYHLLKSQNIPISRMLHYGFWLFYYVLGLLLTHFDLSSGIALTGYCVFLGIFSFLPILSMMEYSITMVCQLFLLLITGFQVSMTIAQLGMLLVLNAVYFVISRYLAKIQLRYFSLSERLSATLKNAEEDPLTGLLNRRGLDKRVNVILPYCIRNKSMVALLIMDIDFFKRYNDSFGHPAGDACLETVAEVLKNTARRKTDIIARIGGEEFLVFIYDTNEMDAILLAESIRSSVEAKHLRHSPTLGGNAIVTVSIGIATTVPTNADGFEHLYSEADKALYYAKKNGRNTVICGGRICSSSTEKAAE